ncbi:hypothetical protein Vafri_12774 [Volvox africanus]|uniref:Cell cycle checkpoint control protein RAD9A n=1 Tax=Volvox africanus TaxID=51714 RepID=A0A8J4BAL9_9CHLO|nr:hypothetical protein Vafri_12774 [Volvox africanus]
MYGNVEVRQAQVFYVPKLFLSDAYRLGGLRMSFRFSLGRAQVKHFRASLQTLNKIGGELLIEAVPQQLVLRSINTAKSAFLSVTYFNRFFDSYEVYDTTVVQTIVLSKNALAILRSQKISQIDFSLDNAAARLRATVHTDEGLIRRYAFDCLDGEVLQATVDRDAYPTVVVAEASELEKLLSSFQHTLDEITLIANPESAAALANGHKACEMRSFLDPLKGSQEAALLTSLTLDTRAVFTSYSHSSPLAADVTFNVKDFRAMTSLCTALGADVALRLEAAGAPLVVEPHFRGLREGGETDFQAMLVLSTLTDSQLGTEHLDQQQALEEEQQQGQQQQGQQQQGQQQHAGVVPQQDPQFQSAGANAEPRTPYNVTGGIGDGGASRGGSVGVATAASTGRGRRRLPPRQDDSSGEGTRVETGTAVRGIYAAAAAAEGLLVTDGVTTAPGTGPQLPPQGPHVPPASGLRPSGDTYMDGQEDDIPARRTGRPPRYDSGNRAAFATGNVGSMGGRGFAPDTSLLHPRPSHRPDHDPRRVMLQGPSDPRVGGAGRSSAHGSHQHQHQQQQQQQQQQYVQFRCKVEGAATTAGLGDSQDPEDLPGMRPSPYGAHGQTPPALRSPSFRSYSVADPRIALASGGTGDVGKSDDGAGAGSGGGGDGDAQQQPMQVSHAELFGDDDDEDGNGGGACNVGQDGYYDIDDDDDEEVPATPPDQQQTRSMGAGVLGLGGGCGDDGGHIDELGG